jgi:high affinity Mn2+ porin
MSGGLVGGLVGSRLAQGDPLRFDRRLPIIDSAGSLAILWFLINEGREVIVNPAYNRDRGPVSVFATRLHAQFSARAHTAMLRLRGFALGQPTRNS